MNHHDVYGKQMQTETLQYKCFCISKIILVLEFWIGNRYTFDERLLATLIYFKYIRKPVIYSCLINNSE